MSVETKVISRDINDAMWEKSVTLATAESCTAGNVAAAITSIPGSSHFYKGGVVCYADEVKVNLLHVNPETLANFGAVSEEVVTEMVKGAMKTFKTDYAIATSGVAGPGGGTPEKPVGTIWLAVADAENVVTNKLEEDHGREINIARATYAALQMLKELVSDKKEEEVAEK